VTSAYGHPPRPHLGHGWFTLSRVLQRFLQLGVVIMLGIAVLDWATYTVAKRWLEEPASVDVGLGRQLDLLTWGLGIAWLIIFITTGVLFIIWLFQAHRSDRMTPLNLEHASGWAIGGWFVPILGLWRPYQMVREVRQGAVAGVYPPAGVLPWWWAAFLVSNLVNWVAAGIGNTDSDRPRRLLEGLRDFALAGLVADVVTVVAGLLAFLVVRGTTQLVADSPHAPPLPPKVGYGAVPPAVPPPAVSGG
jgi:hypothetical protein